MPCDAFNGSLVEQCNCSDAGIQEVLELKRRIISSASIVSVLRLPDMSGMARAERKSVYVLHMLDVSVCLPDVSGMAGTRALIGMQLRFDSYDFIYP